MPASAAQLKYEFEQDEIKHCGDALSDHDWTIHIAAHSHPVEVEDRVFIPGFMPKRVIYAGGDSEAVVLAIATHPDIAYAECSWCAGIYRLNTD
jgi:hypothetical protein